MLDIELGRLPGLGSVFGFKTPGEPNSAGPHVVNDGRKFGAGATDEMLTLQLDYGNPFEQRSRKLFDYFALRGNLTFGAGRKIVDNVVGQGILVGRNVHSGNMDFLVGAFQHYDFWDNKTFELGTIAFGGGVVSKMSLSENSNLYLDLQLGLVPLAGNSTQLGPDTSQFRDYNYGGGGGNEVRDDSKPRGIGKPHVSRLLLLDSHLCRHCGGKLRRHNKAQCRIQNSRQFQPWI